MVPSLATGPLPAGSCGLLLNKAALVHTGVSVIPLVLEENVGQIFVAMQAVSGVHLFLPNQPIAQVLLLPNIALQTGIGSVVVPSRKESCRLKADLFFLQKISAEKPMLTLLLNGKPFRGLIDTGADATVIARRYWPKAWPLEAAPFDLTGIGQAQFPLRSSLILQWQTEEGIKGEVQPFVIDSLPLNLWGRDVLAHMTCYIGTPNNPGMTIMKKSGFLPGQGLGKYSQGRLEPIVPVVKCDRKGIGYDSNNSTQNFL